MSAGPDGKIAALRKLAADNRMAAFVGSNAVTNIIRIASNLLLTRLLAPETFGAIGIIMAVQYLLVMVTDMGFNAFVIRSREGDRLHFLNVVWTVRLVRNAALSAVMFAFSGPLAAAFDKPELQPGIAATAFVLLIDGLRSTSFIVADRQRRVSFMSALELVAFIIQTIVALAAASILHNYWAIVIAIYVNSVILAAFSYVLFPYGGQKPAFDARILRDLWNFGKFVMPSSAITLVLAMSDRVVIGRSMPLDAFGLYMLAVSLTTAGRQLINNWAARLLYPWFAEAARGAPSAVADIYYPTRRKLSLLLALVLGGAVGGGELIARILFDPRYLEAGTYISLLALGPLLALSTVPAENAVVALGRVRSTLEANIVRLVWIAIAAPLGYRFGGMLGLIAAFALIELPALVYWFRRLAEARLLDWKEEGLLALAALAGAAAGYGAQVAADYAMANGMLPAL
ncbi:MAG: oligosaccharide flippase family protein [Parvularculaceae bacterium]